jgi:uncharacterized protein (DUF1501 family)
MDRRTFLALAAAGLAAPSMGRAAVEPRDRKFLFIHNYGGWDTTYVFQPGFGSPDLDMESTATAAEISGIRFVDAAGRPSVRSFFERYAARTCVINGIEIPSITHERCTRLLMTGRADTDADDWGATLAADANASFLLPYLVMAGTAFTARFGSRVVRMGANGQLGDLFSGDALRLSDQAIEPPSAPIRSRVDAFLADRAATLPGRVAAEFAAAHADEVALEAGRSSLDLGGVGPGCNHLMSDVATVLDAFEQGLSRAGLVQYLGVCNQGWDTHSNNGAQGPNFEELFQYLGEIVADLDGRTTPDGGRLSDEVVLVVMSEMGRTPKLSNGGKSHWPFTSMMLLGPGIRGGQVVGGFDAGGYGVGTDLETGEPDERSPGMHVANVGATLLALGDADPGVLEPIPAVLLD